MSGRKSGLYDEIFKFILNLCPNLINLKRVMADYEAAVKKSVKKNFFHAEKKGCWFHYAQVTIYNIFL